MENYAAIDLGTNSCRLLIAGGQKMVPVARDLRTTRLGEGLTESGVLSINAMEKTLQCLKDFKKTIEQYKVKAYRIIATSAVREANNQREFVEKVRQKTGLAIDVITPEEEARLSYSGVTKGLDLAAAPLVVDLGGGSTEFIHWNDENRYCASIQVGAVRATEMGLSAVEIVRRLGPVISQKARFSNSPLVFVGGTATTAVAVKMSLEDYRPELVHGQVMSREELADLYNMVERMPPSLLRRLPGLQPERADIIGRGLLIVLLIVDSLGKTEIIVSESDLLEGIIWELIESDADDGAAEQGRNI